MVRPKIGPMWWAELRRCFVDAMPPPCSPHHAFLGKQRGQGADSGRQRGEPPLVEEARIGPPPAHGAGCAHRAQICLAALSAEVVLEHLVKALGRATSGSTLVLAAMPGSMRAAMAMLVRMPPGCTQVALTPHWSMSSSWRRASVKPMHGKLAGVVKPCEGTASKPNRTGGVDDVPVTRSLQVRQRPACPTPPQKLMPRSTRNLRA